MTGGMEEAARESAWALADAREAASRQATDLLAGRNVSVFPVEGNTTSGAEPLGQGAAPLALYT